MTGTSRPFGKGRLQILSRAQIFLRVISQALFATSQQRGEDSETDGWDVFYWRREIPRHWFFTGPESLLSSEPAEADCEATHTPSI